MVSESTGTHTPERDDAVDARADPRWPWHAAAVAIFLLAMAPWLAVLWGQDARDVVLTTLPDTETQPGETHPIQQVGEYDLRFVVATIARNARALVTNPAGLFDAPSCFPAERSLALGEPLVDLGIVALPAYWLTRDPVLTYNFVLIALGLLSALAMYCLVLDWTGEPAAAIAAGLLFAFHEARVYDFVHLMIYDNAWTVLALLFARRLFARARWRDAAALAACCGMQIAGSFYPLLAATLLALPFAGWLVWQRGVRALPLPQLALVLAAIAVLSVLLLGPFVSLDRAGVLAGREFHIYRPWSWMLPGGVGFIGWPAALLAAAALVTPRRRVLPTIKGDPRWVLVASVVVIVAISGASGPTTSALEPAVVVESDASGTPANLYELLARWLPAFDAVRSPAVVYTGATLALALLAGVGAAAGLALLRGRTRAIAIATLIAIAFVDTLRPAWLALTPRVEYRSIALRPPEERLAFFEELARQGNRGPLLEVPFNPDHYRVGSEAVLLTAYHHRPTSQCYNSFFPPIVHQVQKLSVQLPADREALDALAALGFTTVIVHTEDPFGRRVRRAFERERSSAAEGWPFAPLAADDARTAYAIRASSTPTPTPTPTP